MGRPPDTVPTLTDEEIEGLAEAVEVFAQAALVHVWKALARGEFREEQAS